MIQSIRFLKNGNAQIRLCGPRGQKMTLTSDPHYLCGEIPKVAAMWQTEIDERTRSILKRLAEIAQEEAQR